ncbi:KAP family NTPase [Acidovorax sp. sif1233]|uniref:P-loop NTPase fold protein n=1 Tax=Acidovorax sp. sif1233 TaxID=2854792 RepID=UPI001C4651A6|nr:P-loop NTPase fold protein [Acidovorax sp. sif1233]MBV7457286.1 KAP family NTPase [Acidovorax sp. sif1233]
MTKSLPIRTPEFSVFAKSILLGFLLAEIFRVAYVGSEAFGVVVASYSCQANSIVITVGGALILVAYACFRQVPATAKRIIASQRIDLFLLFGIGVLSNQLLAPMLAGFHAAIAGADDLYAPAVLCAVLVLLSASLLRGLASRSGDDQAQLTFFLDVEIEGSAEDVLGVGPQAQQFAETVLASGAHSGLVFGVDAPWGVGKTSFLKLAEQRWSEDRSVIVIKFQPLRYASDPDLVERFVRELCSGIRQKVFTPEFAPVATRYSRMVKGKTDLSFFGLKLTFEPSTETMDELLEDIDNVLKQVKKRLIIIIDDLDRLDQKLVNNVLFTVRRTFNLSRATYILCYDTEMLIAGKDEGARAREFLEKFITVKLSLFVDGSAIERFLKTDWKRDSERFQTIPADALDKLSLIMSEVAKMVSGKNAPSYAPLLGDLRKVKRFVNLTLLLQIERANLGGSDFHICDLIHLILLNLYYPKIFRKIYLEETENRIGSFSVRPSNNNNNINIENSEGLEEVIKYSDSVAAFLLRQLFDVSTISFTRNDQFDEGVTRSRACFNGQGRNLEKYLKFIVRFQVPLAIETYKFYKEAVDEVLHRRKSIDEILSMKEFALANGEMPQDQFWRILINNAYRLDKASVSASISKLIACLPKFSSSRSDDRGLRSRLIYALVQLLDRAGFGEDQGARSSAVAEVVEIAERIFGKKDKFPQSIIDQLLSPSNGVLGWNDVMSFRLTCSMDRGGQTHNIFTALLRYEDPNASGDGEVVALSLSSMRRISQEIFKRFRSEYVDKAVNFFDAVNGLSAKDIFGEAAFEEESGMKGEGFDLEQARSDIKGFVIYQLTNNSRTGGLGIGCGVYDESGSEDCGGINIAMQEYVLGFCFSPIIDRKNAQEFGDFCLRAIRVSRYRSLGYPSVESLTAEITKIFPKTRLIAFWVEHRELIKKELQHVDRTIVMDGYSATYADSLPVVFGLLDSWVVET